MVPFGLAELQEGKIRVIARGPDVPTLRNQTIRVQIVNANALKERKDVMVRFMRAYRESLDWMYANPLAVKYYAETIKQPESLVVMQRDQYNPKDALSPDRLSDLDQVMADAVEMKFLDVIKKPGHLVLWRVLACARQRERMARAIDQATAYVTLHRVVHSSRVKERPTCWQARAAQRARPVVFPIGKRLSSSFITTFPPRTCSRSGRRQPTSRMMKSSN